MRRIKTGVIGAGFMGKVHTEAIRRLGFVDVAGVAGISRKEAADFARSAGVGRAYVSADELIADPEIEAVHLCTPNNLHAPLALAAIRAGKHVLSEKPIATSVADARKMLEAAKAARIVHCVEHNLRYYPVLQHIREVIASGELGEILVVQGTYSQDWLLYDTDYNWRVDATDNGPMRCVADIGTHWMDLVQHLTGRRITSVCAELQIFHRKRKRPKVAIQTFAGKKLSPKDYEEVPIRTDDFAMVMLHMGRRTRGSFTVSQVSAGCKNRFQIEIYGTKMGVMWNQEEQDKLWIGHRNEPNEILLKDPSLLKGSAAGFADLPGGHSEGYDDTHKQVFRRFYTKIANPKAPTDFPTFKDGLRGMELLDRIMESHKKRAWIDTKLTV